MVKENKIKNLKIRGTALALAAGTIITLTGCSTELAAKEEYDSIEEITTDDGLQMGLTQELDVPGQNFKLVTEYSCDDTSKREWRITSDKFLYLTVYTKGLPEGTEVYIDNIHIDTSIKSVYAAVDGILQDSMDDRIHNSKMIGFPISDSTYYYGVNAIEGSNENFVRVTTYAYSGYYMTEAETRRYTESDYVNLGVYANKVQIVYDLLIKGPNDKEFFNVSVNTDFIVPISDYEIEYETVSGRVKTKNYE